jgi:hypothetical protein
VANELDALSRELAQIKARFADANEAETHFATRQYGERLAHLAARIAVLEKAAPAPEQKT